MYDTLYNGDLKAACAPAYKPSDSDSSGDIQHKDLSSLEWPTTLSEFPAFCRKLIQINRKSAAKYGFVNAFMSIVGGFCY